MRITYLQILELNNLSAEIFGRQSFWYNHLHKKGVKKTKDEFAKDPSATRRFFNTYEDCKTEMLRIKENTAKFIEENPLVKE